MLVISLWWWWQDAVACCWHLKSFASRNLELLHLHTRDPCGIVFMCFLTSFYLLLFLHLLVSPHYIQIHYLVHFACVGYIFALLFMLKIVSDLLELCISLTGQ